jgi:hypothetical protein
VEAGTPMWALVSHSSSQIPHRVLSNKAGPSRTIDMSLAIWVIALTLQPAYVGYLWQDENWFLVQNAHTRSVTENEIPPVVRVGASHTTCGSSWEMDSIN